MVRQTRRVLKLTGDADGWVLAGNPGQLHSYRQKDVQMFGTLIPETALRTGANTVTAIVVDYADTC